MISRSLYISGTGDVLATLAEALAVKPENCFAYDNHESDYTFFTREESSLFFSSIKGDFQFSVDVNVFRIEEPELERKLVALTQAEVIIAMPDEDSDKPYDYILFERGEKQTVRMIEDDDTDEVRIVRI